MKNMSKITFDDKVTLNENTSISAVNKCQASDMNEIKTVVNANYDETTNFMTNYTPTVLFEGINIGTVSLSDSITNYTRLKIFYRDTDANYSFVEVYNPTEGMKILLNTVQPEETTTYIRSTIRLLGETSMANNSHNQVKLTSSSTSIINTNSIYVTRVEGYKY